MLYKYFVWGRVKGTDFYSKLHGSYNLKDAQLWYRHNKKYYDNMIIKERGRCPGE